MSTTEVRFIDGMKLGQGFNTATYDDNPPGLENIERSKNDPGTKGQKVTYRVEVLSNTVDVKDVMNITASASFKYALTAKGSMAAKFANSIKQHSHTLYIIVHVKVTNPVVTINLDKIKLKQQAKILYENNPNLFIDQYGDSFVYGEINGGEFMGLLEIETQTESDFTDIQAALSASINTGEFDGSASADFHEALKNLASSYHMKAYVMRDGGRGGLHNITPEQLQKDALEFPATVGDNDGSPLSVLLMTYSGIPNEAGNEDKISSIVSSQVLKIDELDALKQKFVRYQNKLKNSLDIKELYPGIKVKEIQKRIDKIREQISLINETAKLCFSDRKQCNLPNTIDKTLLEDILPPRISNLGDYWTSKEGGWYGIWVRQGNTETFHATWKKNGNKNTSVLHVHREKNKITIEREAKVFCKYEGTIGADGNTVTGTLQYDVYTYNWSAKIHGLV